MNWIVELRSRLAEHAWPTAGIALLVLLCAVCGSFLPASIAFADDAHEEFASAVRMRTMLEGYLEKDRSASDYKRTIDAYQKIYANSPDSDEATAALIAAAELYEEMGRLYDPKYFDTSIKTYLTLINDYPDSRYGSSALFGIAEIQDYDQKQPQNAQATFQDFLKKYPHSEHADEARKALKEMAAADSASKRGSTVAAQPAPSAPPNTPNTNSGQPTTIAVSDDPAVSGQVVAPHEDDGRISSVKGLQTENGKDAARVIISLDGTIDFQSARIAAPDRIYFNISRATLAVKGGGADFNAQDGLVRAVHAAQNKPDVVRVVVDAPSAKDYNAYLLAKPYRLVIELSSQPGTLHAPAPSSAAASAPPVPSPGTKSAATAPMIADATATAPAQAQAKETPVSLSRHADVPPLGPAGAPKPMSDGDTSLTRALGLKIHRIVIDPGHGGHDTGTVGPHGLLEKDLCLDVALRLGREIEQKLPGAEVVYTRQDDTFIPLEERTRIANDAKADLFISIHANSSHDDTARGVETYYLNFSTSADSMEVAARENAFSQESIHDLQDVIKKIARNDKIEESKELAGDVQQSLSHKLEASSPAVRDRGVKQAPFVVLIGADMPSILAEISFVSNPTDEKLLKTTPRRQQIADGLFRGITNYLDSLNSLSGNKQKSADAAAVSADNRLEAHNTATAAATPK